MSILVGKESLKEGDSLVFLGELVFFLKRSVGLGFEIS